MISDECKASQRCGAFVLQQAEAKGTIAHLTDRASLEELQIKPEAWHQIQAPALVIGGGHDVIKPAHTLLIAPNIPNAYLWVLPNSGHSTPLVYPDQLNRKIDDFFSQAVPEN